MITISNRDYVPFNEIKHPKSYSKTAGQILYSDLFSGSIAKNVIPRLSKFLPLMTSKKSVLCWFSDDPSRIYSFTDDQLQLVSESRDYLFLYCLKQGLENLTGQKFNCCQINKLALVNPRNWNKYFTADAYSAYTTFGINPGSLSVAKRNNKPNVRVRKSIIPVNDGSVLMIPNNAFNIWKVEKGIPLRGARFYTLVFRNIKPEITRVVRYNSSRRLESTKPINLLNPADNTDTEDDLPRRETSPVLPSSPSPAFKMSDHKLEDIYRSAKTRAQVYAVISREFNDIDRNHGHACVNGFNEELLRHLDLIRLLGTGSFGNVYLGCIPKGCPKRRSFKFAVKLAKMDKRSFKTPFAPYVQSWHEAIVNRDIINNFVLNGICPNFPIVYDYFTCENCEFKFRKGVEMFGKGGEPKLKKANYPCMIGLTELANGGSLLDWLNEKPRAPIEIYSALFQIMAGLHTLQNKAQIINGDIKSPNILVYKIEAGGYWEYVIKGRRFYCPNLGFVMIVNDFGTCMSTSPDIKLRATKTKKFKTLGERYAIIDQLGNYDSLLTSKRSFSIATGKPNSLTKTKLGVEKDEEDVDFTAHRAPSIRIVAREETTTGTGLINPDTGAIKDSQIQFTPQQKQYLESLGIPADSANPEFYRHPEIVPPRKFMVDTQDALLMFTGGSRLMQQGSHPDPENVPEEVKYKLRHYVDRTRTGQNIFYCPQVYALPAMHLAGYFIIHFFLHMVDFTDKPRDGRKIETYRIS